VTEQLLPVPQGGQLGPPQSLADSPWFCTPSLQVACVQALADVHSLLSQSLSFVHVPDAGQGAHSSPPQSSSVSLLLLTPSVQPAATHTSPWHRPLWQSGSTSQALPFEQPGQLPPQSMLVSCPFRTWSWQSGA
jgi:hypothetical protein